jgi:hypothetical protein
MSFSDANFSNPSSTVRLTPLARSLLVHVAISFVWRSRRAHTHGYLGARTHTIRQPEGQFTRRSPSDENGTCLCVPHGAWPLPRKRCRPPGKRCRFQRFRQRWKGLGVTFFVVGCLGAHTTPITPPMRVQITTPAPADRGYR